MERENIPAVDFGPKVDKEVERLETSEKLTEEDKETLFEYKRDMEVEGLSPGRIFKLFCHTRKIAEQLGDKNLVDATEDNLEGRAPLMAIEEGYYVMLHKANEALALAGFKPMTHECTLLGLRGVFNAPELADKLRRASRERKNVDYYINPKKPELEEFKDPEKFVNEVMRPFVAKLDELIREKFE